MCTRRVCTRTVLIEMGECDKVFIVRGVFVCERRGCSLCCQYLWHTEVMLLIAAARPMFVVGAEERCIQGLTIILVQMEVHSMVFPLVVIKQQHIQVHPSVLTYSSKRG